MRIRMRLGDGWVLFDVPARNVAGVIHRKDKTRGGAPERFVSSAVRGALPIAAGDCTGRNVLVLVADGTRDQAHRAGYAALAPLLREARTVRVLIATGTHKADTPDNRRIAESIREVSAAHRIPLASVDAHDCRSSRFYFAGTTRFGNRVRLNQMLQNTDAILLVSDSKPHYFAGYSNATKFFVPGAAAFPSIERDHALALDRRASVCRHPLHRLSWRRENPVAEDQLDAARLVAAEMPVYALVTGGGRHPVWALFGRLEDAVREGIRLVDKHFVAHVRAPCRRVVVGCGGYPSDESLYVAQRSLELSGEAIADGAEVLWLAECRNGIASSREAVRNFFTPLTRDPREYVSRIRRRYRMFSHKTVRLLGLMERVSVLRMVSRLPEGTLPLRNIQPCAEPVRVVAEWVREGEKVLFIEDASHLAVAAKVRGAATGDLSLQGYFARASSS